MALHSLSGRSFGRVITLTDTRMAGCSGVMERPRSGIEQLSIRQQIFQIIRVDARSLFQLPPTPSPGNHYIYRKLLSFLLSVYDV
jgi:hypothetical protein